MKQRPRRIILRKLLLRPGGHRRLWPALLSLCFGTVILLYALVLYTGFRDVLAGKYDKDRVEGTYLTISKPIDAQTEITRQEPATFTNTEIRALGSLPGVKDIGMFTSARFPVEVSFTGENAKFSTSLFIESVPERFIDNKPLDWYWQPSAKDIPVIVSVDFLDLYNFGYAPNQGVPQLTKGTIQSLTFTLKAGTGELAQEFTARVAGFSDRISSIIVPQTFLDYANDRFAAPQPNPQQPSRLIVLVNDPSDPVFTEYLRERKYETNNELLRFSRMRVVVYAASAGMGLLAVILLFVGAAVFTLFTDLTIARAQHNLQLLIHLGYSPRFLGRFIYIRYAFVILAVMLVVAIGIIIAQVRTAKYALDLGLHIARFPGWEIWVGLLLIMVVLLVWVKSKVNKGVV